MLNYFKPSGVYTKPNKFYRIMNNTYLVEIFTFKILNAIGQYLSVTSYLHENVNF